MNERVEKSIMTFAVNIESAVYGDSKHRYILTKRIIWILRSNKKQKNYFQQILMFLFTSITMSK